MSGRGPDPKSTNSYRFESTRLLIDLPKPEDARFLFEMMSGDDREAICGTLIWDGPADLTEMEEWVDRCRSSSFADFGFHWVIRDRLGEISGDAGRPLGNIGTRPREAPGRADVGYWLGRSYWGQGVMSEALGALLDYGFDTLDYTKIEADVFTHNTRGRRLVERVGMRQEGTIRSAHLKYGEWVDAALYGVLSDDRLATN
ncbi:MAG: GNAT family N-acetyltransferase [Acidimicrobiia bacterium]|nr:GNAT family N-acetyltransferase [Acidimicrobiia bacterium]